MKFQYAILLVLTVIAAVAVSGCLSTTPDGPGTADPSVEPDAAEPSVPAETETDSAVADPAENTQTESLQAAQETQPTDSSSENKKHIIVSRTSDKPAELYYPIGFSRTFGPSSGTDNTIAMYQGESIRFWNGDTKLNSRMLFHSVEGSFDDIVLNPRYDCYMTFPELGKYQIRLYDGERFNETGQYVDYQVGASMLTIYIVEKEDNAQ